MTTSPDEQDALELYRKAIADAAEVAATADTGSDLAPLAGAESGKQMKQRLGSARQRVAHARNTALVAQGAAKELIEAKKRELDLMLQELNGQLEPLTKQLHRFEDGIQAFNLYLGRDEEIVQVLDGEPAPADTPIHVRQMALAMDEETAVATDRGGLDFYEIDQFIQWLAADPAHVDQLIPEAKSVVAIRPRHEEKHYTDDFRQNRALNEPNWRTFWLIRNGERLWITETDFQVGEHVVPTASEFTSFFTRKARDGSVEHLQPGTDAWVAAEEAADKRTRHYMKVALILQGLMDRTKVFHPIPEPTPSFLVQEFYDSGVINVITDDELAIGTGRVPFNEWLRKAGSKLTAGMRIVGSFNGYHQGFVRHSNTERWIPANVRPEGAQPEDGVHTIKLATASSGFQFSFQFDRGEVWDENRGMHRPAKTKATGMFNAGDKFVIPIDTVTVEEMEEYLTARTERSAYLTMFPLLKAAVKFKRDEQELESPFREALIAQLLTLDGGDITGAAHESASAEADDLITWFKTSNKWHRALEPNDSKSASRILNEARRRRSGVDKDAESLRLIRQYWAETGDTRNIMVIARRSRDYVAVIPEVRKYSTESVSHTVFVTLVFFTPTGTVIERRDWVNLSRAQTAGWSVLESDDRWASWTISGDKKIHFSDPEIDEAVEYILTGSEAGTPFEIRWKENTPMDNYPLNVKLLLAGEEQHSHREVSVEVTRTKGRMRVEVRPGHAKRRWGQSRDVPEWKENYGGALVKSPIWNDPVVEAAETERWNAFTAERKAERAHHNLTSDFVRSIDIAWEEREWERLKARYIEDYGDDGLWDEHKKTLRTPNSGFNFYRHESGRGDMSLYKVVSHLLKAGAAVGGKTVAEAAEASDTDPATLPADVLELRFPEKPNGIFG